MHRLTSRQVCRHLGILLSVAMCVPPSSAAQTTPPRSPIVPGAAPRDPVTVIQLPRDRPPAPRAGTAVLKGRVVDGVTGNPIPRARVRILANAAQPTVLTDGFGSFEFTGLPPGIYPLLVEKSTYVAGRYPEASRSLRAARPRPVRDGEVVEISIPMFRGGAITGRILDAHGDPLDLAQVRVLRVSRGGRPATAGQTQTNDLGEYRVPRLSPGRYLLQVRPQMQSQGGFPESAAETPLPQPLPTYYPNVLSLAQAQAITVNRGETISGVDMMLAEGVPTLVVGMVVRSDGQTISGGSVSIRNAGPDATSGFDGAGGTGIRPGGAFRLTLPPGEYTFDAQVASRETPGPGSNEPLFGSAQVAVGGGTVEDLTITVGRGATATGRIVFEGSSRLPSSPGQPRVPLYNPHGPGCRSGEVTVAADWTFKIDGLNGTCLAQPAPIFGQWMLKALTIRGQNLMDQLMTFETGQHYANVQLVVSDRRTQMDLSVSGDDGQPTREYVAIAFPTDKERWTLPQPLRRIGTHAPRTVTSLSMARPTPAAPPGPGAGVGPTSLPGGGPPERIVGLQPGEYYVIALDDIEFEDSQDPAVLERLASSAARVVLTDDGPLEVPLRRFNFAAVMR